MVNAIAKDALKGMGAETVGEEYCAFGTSDVKDMVAKIRQAKPDVVLSTIAGETNLAFYSRLRQAGVTLDQIPVISCSVGENELRKMDPKDLAGHYRPGATSSRSTGRKTRSSCGSTRRSSANEVVTDVSVASYNSVRLWAQAVEERFGSTSRRSLFLLRQSLDALEGVISVDPETRHTWRPFYLGKARLDGQFDLAWSVDKPIRPCLIRSRGVRRIGMPSCKGCTRGGGGTWANPSTTTGPSTPE